MSQNTISFRIRLVINHAYGSYKPDCNAVRDQTLKVLEIGTSLWEEVCSLASIKSRYMVFLDDLFI